jgi:hypothetical protein
MSWVVQLERECPVEEDDSVPGSDLWTAVTSCLNVQ